MSIIFSIVSLHTQSDTTSFEIFEQFNLTDRFFFASYSICYYLIHLFVPINLSAFHSMPEKYQGYLPIDYYLAVIPIIFLILIGFKKSKLQKEYIFGIAFFLISLSLNIHIIPFGKAIVAERYTYLPYIGIYYLIGQTYCYFIERFQSLLHLKKVIYLIGTCVVIVFGFITFQRIAVWKNTLTLFDDASLKANSTKEAVTIQALGFILEAENKTNARKYTEAIELYDRAILLNPQRVESYSNRGIAKHCLLDYEGAMKDYSKAIELNPSFSRAYANRAAIHLVQNRLSEACSDLRKAYDLGLTGVLPTIQANCY
jgi:tetratricopeptide (TPR) repeat protein